MSTKNNHHPLGYIAVILFILLSAIFWWILLSKMMKENVAHVIVAEENYSKPEYFYPVIDQKPIPIIKDDIEIDSVNNREIVSNRVNVAIVNKNKSILDVAMEIKQHYPSPDFEVIYMDTVINRLQLKLPNHERISFKDEIKHKMSGDSILVWDETLFRTFDYQLNDPLLKDINSSWYLDYIDIQNAWDITYGNPDVTIAVLDNGFDLNHPELVDKYRNPYDVINGTDKVSANKINHGTHVASTAIGKRDNNSGLVGTCPDCTFMPIKIEDENGYISSSYVIDGILYAIKNDADVINISLGLNIPIGHTPPVYEQEMVIEHFGKDEERFWKELFDLAEKRGVICVLAAGNNNLLTGLDPFARSNKTIKVGAIQRDGEKAVFSNHGHLTTVYAPGVNIIGAKPGNDYEMLEGTSMAAPIVSGLIGLIKSKNNNLSNKDVLSIFEKNIKIQDELPVLSIKTIM